MKSTRLALDISHLCFMWVPAQSFRHFPPSSSCGTFRDWIHSLAFLQQKRSPLRQLKMPFDANEHIQEFRGIETLKKAEITYQRWDGDCDYFTGAAKSFLSFFRSYSVVANTPEIFVSQIKLAFRDAGRAANGYRNIRIYRVSWGFSAREVSLLRISRRRRCRLDDICLFNIQLLRVSLISLWCLTINSSMHRTTSNRDLCVSSSWVNFDKELSSDLSSDFSLFISKFD